MRRFSSPIAFVTAVALFAACGSPPISHTAENAQRASPLGKSFVLNPLPGEDDALLGRVLLSIPEDGRSLEQVTRPNPCLDKLTEAKTTPTVGSFQDAEELSATGKARAALGAFGFDADASYATHFVYKVDTSKKESRVDTNEYVACCKEKGGCGYGFVSALVYGDGEYSTAEEANGSASASLVMTSVEGTTALKILHSRKVHGWIAALVTVTDPNAGSKANELGPLGGDVGIKLDEQSLKGQVRERFAEEKIELGGIGAGYVFKLGLKPITENEFARRYDRLFSAEPLPSSAIRPYGPLVGSVALMGASGVVLGLGIKAATKNEKNALDSPGALILSTFGAIGGICWFAISVVGDWDGQPEDHNLSHPDAELYVAKYNRALLKKSIKDSQEMMQKTSSLFSPKVSLVFAGTSLSLVGAF